MYIYLLMFTIGISTYASPRLNNPSPKNDIGLRVYPNPAHGGEVYITTKSNGLKNVVIYNVFGTPLLKDAIATNTLNISKLPAGVYIVEVTENDLTTTQKLVVK